MKQIPLLFQGNMVRALRNARPGVWPAVAIDETRPFKWQTRRVMPLQPEGFEVFNGCKYVKCSYVIPTGSGDHSGWSADITPSGMPTCVNFNCTKIPCRYGRAGDVAWVREAFAIETNKYCDVDYQPPFGDGRPVLYEEDIEWGRWWSQCHYRATDPRPELDYGDGAPGVKWQPSIHMPRWASRDDLLIKWIRAERVQAISEADARADARAEGVGSWNDMFDGQVYRPAFSLLWNQIHSQPKLKKSNPYSGARERCYVSYPWVDERGEEAYRGLTHYVVGNPWVWAIAFMRMVKSDGG